MQHYKKRISTLSSLSPSVPSPLRLPATIPVVSPVRVRRPAIVVPIPRRCGSSVRRIPRPVPHASAVQGRRRGRGRREARNPAVAIVVATSTRSIPRRSPSLISSAVTIALTRLGRRETRSARRERAGGRLDANRGIGTKGRGATGSRRRVGGARSGGRSGDGGRGSRDLTDRRREVRRRRRRRRSGVLLFRRTSRERNDGAAGRSRTALWRGRSVSIRELATDLVASGLDPGAGGGRRRWWRSRTEGRVDWRRSGRPRSLARRRSRRSASRDRRTLGG